MANPTRSRMIETTARLLQLRGYYGTSLNDILAASGAPRGSLYFHFPGGKDQLVLEATRSTIQEVTDLLSRALEDADNPADATRAYFAAAAELMEQSNYEFGCPVAPVVLDGNAGLAELADICREAFETWTGMLEIAYLQAGATRDRAGALALIVSSSLEGALMISRSYQDPGPILTVGNELDRILESAFLPLPDSSESPSAAAR